MSVQPISAPANPLPVAPAPTARPTPAPLNAPAGSSMGAPFPAASNLETSQRLIDSLREESSRSTEKPNKEQLDLSVKKANQAINLLRSNLQFTVDEETGINVVKFVDTQTKEVIRQIPSEEMLAIAKRLDELKGLLISEKA